MVHKRDFSIVNADQDVRSKDVKYIAVISP